MKDRERVEKEIAEQWGKMPSRTARDFKDALGMGKSLRVRQVEIVSLSKTANTATVKLEGSTVSGVPYSNMLPVPGYSSWAMTDGEDIFIFAGHHKAPGDAIKLNRDSNQSITDSTDTKIDFSDPADNTTQLPQNSAFDYYGAWSSSQVSRLYLPAPGQWTVMAQVEWSGDVDGRRITEVWNANDNVIAKSVTPSQGASIVVPQSAMTQIRATDVSAGTANEYLRINVWHNGGAGVVVNGLNVQYSPILVAIWEGPAGAETIFNV